jgi:hypothetical protein
MAESLREQLLTDENRPGLIADAEDVLAAEVADKRGASGVMVKAGYKTVHTVRPGFVTAVLGAMLPDFLSALQPFWDDFTAAGGGNFGSYLAGRPQEASEALLAVADERAAKSTIKPLVSLYGKMRGQASKHVIAALPRVGALVQGKMTG